MQEKQINMVAACREVSGYLTQVREMREAQTKYFSCAKHDKATFLKQAKQLEQLTDKRNRRMVTLIERIATVLESECEINFKT